MKYVSTRGGEPVSGLEAVCRGISRSGGLFVPQSPPEPLSLPSLAGLSLGRVMAVFLHRFLPDLPLEIWETAVSEAFESLAGNDRTWQLPLSKLNDYLDSYFLLNADHLPTGNLADLSHALLAKLWPYMPAADRQPFVLTLLPEDSLVSFLNQAWGLPGIILMAAGGSRGREIAGLAPDGVAIRVFEGSYDGRYRELTRLASHPSFEKKLNDKGFDPLFLGPGHLLEVLTAGALATAVVVAIAESSDLDRGVDFAVPKSHLGFVAGLVCASILRVPVGTVYVGESEPPSLTTLFRTGKPAGPVKNRRAAADGTDFPVNLERLFYEVTGRDGNRTDFLCQQIARPGERLLTGEEINLLNQSILVSACDYKYCLRLIKTVYDQTDYLVGRDTADAVACWAKYADRKAGSVICYVQERSPLLDAVLCGRALFGREAGKEDILIKVSQETGVPVWPSLARLPEDGQACDWPALTGSIEEAVDILLDSQDPVRQGGIL
ncbi:MAG TPA: hypothetical protein PK646_04565 [Bacillota bacterium]|jgi:threonine synthase|nr:hypothetical protein [Fastidiosipila sp.]HPX93103.1 hypothetical protein [Bacillota bacterium]HQB81346.1 hypothetical protein [Bacillota bacterium]